MAIDDNWGEALRKSAEQVTPGDRSEYYLKVKDVSNTDPSAAVLSAIFEAPDKLEVYTYLDITSVKNKRVNNITYSAVSVSPTALIVDTFSYTLQGGEYHLSSIQRAYTP